MRQNSTLSFRIDVPRSTGSIEVKSRTPYGVINALSTRLRAHSAIGRANRLCLFFSDDDSGGSVAVASSVGYRTLRARWKNVKWWLVIAVANGSPTSRLVGRRSIVASIGAAFWCIGISACTKSRTLVNDDARLGYWNESCRFGQSAVLDFATIDNSQAGNMFSSTRDYWLF